MDGEPPAKAGFGMEEGIRRALTDVALFSRLTLPAWGLRRYQIGPARAIAESVVRGHGRQFAVVFSRQSGKDELIAQLIAFLLIRYQRRGGNVVLAAPTFRPQAALSRDRLLARLAASPLVARPRLRDGYVVEVGRASARFLSAAPGANARGQTADLLLVANEAQDILPATWDAVFDPMAVSTDATTVFLGTVWSRETLLARQIRFLSEVERRDGVRRVWRVPWDQVARELPVYGQRVRQRIDQFGIDHPFIQTEYFLNELEGSGGLFPPHRLAQMRGDHPRQRRATAGHRYALLLDVAGEEEGAIGPDLFVATGRRDSTALTVIEVVEPAADEAHAISRLPIYRVVDRMAWTGVRHTTLHARLVDLAREVWRARLVVVDATGIGAGLASFLAATLGERRSGQRAIPVLPFLFTRASKSALGWDFLGLIDSGRFKEYVDDGDHLTRLFHQQLAATTYETPAGAGTLLHWSVPASRGHDDLVMSAALAATLDGFPWRSRTARGVSPTERDSDQRDARLVGH